MTKSATKPEPPKILLNAARCRKCGTIVMSLRRHDFAPCECKAIFVDGGYDYLRYGGEDTAFDADFARGIAQLNQAFNEKLQKEREEYLRWKAALPPEEKDKLGVLEFLCTRGDKEE